MDDGINDMKKQTEDKRTVAGSDELIVKSKWYQVFSACLGKMMAIQNACADIVVKGQNWNVDFTKGVISFGSDEYPLQLIGSEAASDQTWLWGWKNINGFDEKLIATAKATRELGEQWGLAPLTAEKFPINDTFNGHSLSIVTCGISKDNLCYYRGPHRGGAILVAFSDVPPEVFLPIDMPTFMSLVIRCIENYRVDHKVFVESLLQWNKTEFEWSQNTLVARFEQDLHIQFEQANEVARISSMKTV